MRIQQQIKVTLLLGVILIVIPNTANAEPVTTGTATTPPAVAVPSQASPYTWPDQPDTRPPDAVPQAEQEKRGMEFLRAFHPLRAHRIETEKQMHPDERYGMMREAYHRRREMEHLRLEAPEEFARREKTLQTEARCEQLALAYRQAPPDKQPAIETELRNLAGQSFDQRQAEMEEELKRLESEYQRMKTLIEKRRKYKDRVIDLQLIRLLGEEEIFEMW